MSNEQTPLLKHKYFKTPVTESGKIEIDNCNKKISVEVLTKNFNIDYDFIVTCSNHKSITINKTINGAIIQITKKNPEKKCVIKWIARNDAIIN